MTERSRNYMPQDERRLQLLEMGLRLFGARSYEDVSIDDIAREGGVSRGLLYHYFGSKRGFYTEVVRFAGLLLLQGLLPNDELSGDENLLAGLHAFFHFVDEHSTSYLALMHGGLGFDDQVREVIEETRATIVDQILDGVKFPLENNALTRVVARSWLGSVETAALRWLEHRSPAISELIPVLASSLMASLATLSLPPTERQDRPLSELLAAAAQRLREHEADSSDS